METAKQTDQVVTHAVLSFLGDGGFYIKSEKIVHVTDSTTGKIFPAYQYKPANIKDLAGAMMGVRQAPTQRLNPMDVFVLERLNASGYPSNIIKLND